MWARILDLCPGRKTPESATAIRHQQNWRQDAAQAAGGKRALYPGAVWSGHRFTTIRDAAMRARRKERQETSGCRSSTKISRFTASALGKRRGI